MAFDGLLLFIPAAVFWGQPLLLLPVAWWAFDTIKEGLWLRSLRQERGKEYVYFFSQVGQLFPSVKIGRTNDIKSRLSAHRTAAPYGLAVWLVLTVNDSTAIERELHQRHAIRRMSGEWFTMPLWLRVAMLIARIR